MDMQNFIWPAKKKPGRKSSICPDNALMNFGMPEAVKNLSPGRALAGRMRDINWKEVIVMVKRKCGLSHVLRPDAHAE